MRAKVALVVVGLGALEWLGGQAAELGFRLLATGLGVAP